MPGSESAALFRLADHLDEHAATVRSRARRLELGGTQMPWQSYAAGAFRDRLGELTSGLYSGAAGLERAAGALRRHAHAVRRLEELANAVGRAGEQVANGMVRAGRYVTGWM